MKNCVITSAVRTAVGGYLGSLKTVEDQDLASIVIKEAMERSGITGSNVEEVILGDTYGYTPNVARCASLLSNIPEEVPAYSVDRQCASSIQAVINAVQQIKSTDSEILIAGGVETMSRLTYYLPPSSRYEGFKLGNSLIYDTFTHGSTTVQPQELYPGTNMGITAENLAEKYNISREEQDQYALESQQKTYKAMDQGKFADEIVPVKVIDRKKSFIFNQDEHPRPETTMETLRKLKPVFLEDGSVTAGNASGMNDGASAVVIMSEDKAKSIGLEPLVKIISYATVGVNPRLMGIGPAVAINKVLEKTNLNLEDIDLIEINEAFAAQVLGVLKELKITRDSEMYNRINVNGGAIAHGHALANSGTRILTTLIYELRRRNKRYGMVSLCIGGGMGTALLVENYAFSK